MNITQKMLLLVLLLFAYVAFGQNVPPPPKQPPRLVPIDSILWLGGVVALGYGIYKKNKNQK